MPANGNKKKETSSSSNSTFTIGDIVLAKVKGYPSWPGHIVDSAGAPAKVQKDKPAKSTTHHLVQFFTAGDYAWTALKEIDHLSTAQIQAYIDSPSKKKGDLLNAYKVAADPLTWINERDEAQNAWDALNNAEPVDQLASGDEAAGTSKTAAKKRKRKSDGGESEKPAKESKKKSTSEDKSGKKAKPEKNSKGQVVPSGRMAEEEAEPSSKKSKTAVADPDEEPGLTQVKDWRHKLQKIFLNAKDGIAQAIPANEMPKCKEYFDGMEKFEMKASWLAASKLGKVLKRIAALQPGVIPGENDFHFIERSTTIANTWSVQVANELSSANGQAEGSSSSNSAAKIEAPVVEAPPPAAVAVPEVQDVEMVAARPTEIVIEEKKVEVVSEAVPEEKVNGSVAVEGVEEVKTNGDHVEVVNGASVA